MELSKCMDMAKNEVERKIAENKLFKSCDDSPESNDFDDGDPETLYSISSLYGQFAPENIDDADELICDYLVELFPEYV